MRAFFLTAALFASTAAQAQYVSQQPDEAQFRALFKEMVETDTSVTTGSCTAAAEKLAMRFKAAGFGDSDITQFSVPEFPKDGGIVIHLKGSDPKVKPMLLLGHLDVVAAKPEDWTRSPFKLIEEDGYFYGRGTFDDKAQASIWADLLIRMKAGKGPKRTIKLALTCGEETTYAFNGADWLAKNRPELIMAEFALNEGGGGRNGPDGKPQGLAVQVGEKTVQNFWIEATNPGGHSSVPRPDNAITDLTAAVVAVNRHEFPVQFTDTTRTYFTTLAKVMPNPVGPAMARLLTPVAKFWICKRGSAFAQEAMECLGGNGYVEEGGQGVMARIYREMPLNSIWEGAGNIMALDLLRALRRAPDGEGGRRVLDARRPVRD
jgi:acetylornithine deacetylase/succinyl-diaminopimelate desuccinylase-like protein